MIDLVALESLYAEPSRNGLTRPKRVRGAGFKMINMGELFAHDRINNPPMDLVPMSEDEVARFGVQAGDLLFARQSLVAEGAGKCSIALRVPEITTFESHLIRVRLDRKIADPLFYFYYFSSPSGKANVQSLVMQVAAAGIRGSELAKLKIPRLSLLRQRRIASILSAYDDLIENNTRRIAILEEMARRIYEEWFVRFRFPGHENVRMVESELGLVPEGWCKRKLGDDIELAYGKALKSEERIAGEVPVYGSSGIVGYHNASLVGGPGIIVGRKGNVGSVYWSDVPFYPIDTVYFVKTPLPFHFVFFNLKQQNFLNNDAAVPGLNRNQAYALPLLLPDGDLLAAFETRCGPLLEFARLLAKTNTNLRTTRDLLLPKLISGELDVSDLPDPEIAAA